MKEKESKVTKKTEKSEKPQKTEKSEKKNTPFFQPLYRQMDISVTRTAEDVQTDIRIHRETGKPTDIYVSRGSDAWTVSPKEVNQLPSDLQQEVYALLDTHSERSRKSWLEILNFWDSQRSEPSLLEGRRHSSGNCE